MSVLNRIREDNQVLIMGILNVTPDSFSDGGKFFKREKAVDRAVQMEESGADIVDIGGESTRPGADEVPLEEELSRTVPVIEEIRQATDVPISIDTYKSEVADKALDAGADMINDISALRFDPELGSVAAGWDVHLVLMHMQGTPRTMQENPTYEDPVDEIIEFLQDRVDEAEELGVDGEKIIVDPGIGFGKRLQDNYEILRRLEEFGEMEHPLLLGTSRKSFIGDMLGLPTEERLEGTIASNVVGVIKGADILRVHDVKEVHRAKEIAVRCR
ncbi:dihydropteroate synthase [Candidatus Bipolaricaulota bacterium]|nr:dihydropteroate synthase [Candidatus Bipolaricaulota bacterium]